MSIDIRYLFLKLSFKNKIKHLRNKCLSRIENYLHSLILPLTKTHFARPKVRQLKEKIVQNEGGENISK